MARDFDAELTIGEVSALRVLAFNAIHQAGRPFLVDVEAVLGGDHDLEDLAGQVGVLSFGAVGEEPRVLHGIVEAATAIGSADQRADMDGTRYAVRIVSRLALLARSVDSRIYQDKTVKEIVADVLERHSVEKVEWRLTASYPKREYCVQYQESALDFVSRLCEHEGIYSFVEPSPDGEIIVFADDSTTAAPMSGDPEIPLRTRAALADTRDAAYLLRQQERVRSGKFVLRDFDFKRPRLDLTSEKAAKDRTSLEVYDYPGGYFEPSEGQRLAKVRLEEEQVLRKTVEIEGVCPRIAVGQKLTIADAGDAGGEMFAFWVNHRFVNRAHGQQNLLAKDKDEKAPSCMVRARLLPAKVPYRPARKTPIPVIEGPQTATVVAPAGSPIETIHTEEYGRCKVKFRWDRSDIGDDKASCWMRVTQLQTSGSVMIPRIGWEVIIEFLEGDPDRPIITGRLYNGTIMPPYALPEGKTRTSLKSSSSPGGGGNNEVRFEDKAGQEEIMMNAQHDMKVVAANNSKTSVGNNATQVIANNSSLEVGANQTTQITKGSSTTIGANQTVNVGGNRKVEVNAVTALTAHGNGTIKVGGNQFEMDGNPLEALLNIAAQAAEQFVSSLADNAVAAVQSQVDGAINQVLAPINQLNSQIQNVQGAMNAVRGGDLSGVGSMVANASGIPGASQLASAMGGGGGGGAGAGAGGGGGGGLNAGAVTNPLASMAQGAARNAIHQGTGAARNALANALGLDSGGGGGQSGMNAAGPGGAVAGVDATDREKGPGHSTALIAGTHDETVGSIKALGAIQQIDTNVTGNKTIDVGAATIQLAIGNYAETAGGSKKESALGLVVLSKAGESEMVGAAKTTMVGGAIVDKLSGSHAIQAGGPATFIGAFHKVEAAGKIVFKCGASELVVDSSGVTITSPIVAFLAPKIQLPKKVSEV